MLTISANSMTQVVELSLAKEILYRCGYGQRRNGDYLLLFSSMSPTGFYVGEEGAESVANLYIDEGTYGNALHRKQSSQCFFLHDEKHDETRDVTIETTTAPWCEYVDACTLFGLVVKKLLPDCTVTPSPYMGGGRSNRHYMEQYLTLLVLWTMENQEKRQRREKHDTTILDLAFVEIEE